VALVAVAPDGSGTCPLIHIPDFYAGHPQFATIKARHNDVLYSLNPVSRGLGRTAARMAGICFALQRAKRGKGVARYSHGPVDRLTKLRAVRGVVCRALTDPDKLEEAADVLALTAYVQLLRAAPWAAARMARAAALATHCGLTVAGTPWTCRSYTHNCDARETRLAASPAARLRAAAGARHLTASLAACSAPLGRRRGGGPHHLHDHRRARARRGAARRGRLPTHPPARPRPPSPRRPRARVQARRPRAGPS
jgi:hypothetical protein